jgi:predicted dehydrogenase
MPEVRAAVIGVGRMGRNHVQALTRLGIPVVGVCDTSAESLKLTELPEDRCFQDAREMLSAVRPELVVVATTCPTHAEYTLLAAGAGARHILCEKPMAASLEQCDRMLSFCAESGARLAINHPMRFMQIYQYPRKMLDVTSMTIVAGNIGLAMNGSHYFEAFRFITGEAPVLASAWLSPERVPNPRGPDFLDRGGSVRLSTASGKRLYLECSPDQGHGLTVTYGARDGQMQVDELSGFSRTIRRAEADRALPTTRYGTAAEVSQVDIEPATVVEPTMAVISALLAGEGYPTGEEGRLAIQALVASHVSDENGHQPISLSSPDLPRVRVFPWA